MSEGVLLPYQQDWVKDTAEVRVYEKSRRIGISWGSASESALEAAAANGMDQWYIGYNKEMAEEFINDCAFWIKNYQLVADEMIEETVIDGDKEILTYVIRCASGNRITALSSRPTNLRGKQGHVIIDEAAFHDNLDGLIKAAMALLMWGGRVSIISTHNGVDNSFNQLCEDIRAGRKPYSLHKTTFKQAVEQKLYHRICAVRGINWSAEGEAAWVAQMYDNYGDDAAEELDVIPSNSGGAVLSRALLELRAEPVPVVRLEKPTSFSEYPEHLRRAEIADWCQDNLLPLLEQLDPGRAHCFGEDFGRVSDLTVIAPLEIGQTTQRRVPFLVELRNIPYAQQAQILFYLADRLPRLRGGALDATGNGEYLAETARDRYGSSRIIAVKLNNGWYGENMPPFVAALEDGNLAIPKDDDVITDLRALQRIDGVIKLPKGKTDKDKKRHGDAAIALALAYFASLADVVEYGYEAVPRHGAMDQSEGWDDDNENWNGWHRGVL